MLYLKQSLNCLDVIHPYINTPVSFRCSVLNACFGCLSCNETSPCLCVCMWTCLCLNPFRGKLSDGEQIRFLSRQQNNLIFLTYLVISWHDITQRPLVFQVCNHDLMLYGSTVMKNELSSGFVFISNRKHAVECFEYYRWKSRSWRWQGQWHPWLQ